MVTCSTIQHAMSHGDPYHHMQKHHKIVSLSYVQSHIEFQTQLEKLRGVSVIKFSQEEFCQDSF
jgi:hypothetical protein